MPVDPSLRPFTLPIWQPLTIVVQCPAGKYEGHGVAFWESYLGSYKSGMAKIVLLEYQHLLSVLQ